MSRIGKQPITVPSGVDVTIDGGNVRVKGPKGQLEYAIVGDVTVARDGDTLVVARADDTRVNRSLHGLQRTLIANMVTGVSDGFVKELEIVGVGYRAQAQGDKLNLALGFSHPVVHPMPQGIKVETPTQTEILIKGMDRQLVGQVAAEVRAYRGPEPYKGKGVRYANEQVVIKETKKK
jgi:large subunit ribosomal protein L6